MPRFLLLVAVCATLVSTSVVGRSTPILARVRYTFAPWDSLPRAARAVDRADYERAATDSTFRLERITYASDSLRVAAYLATPVTRDARPRPCVVFVRGSWRVDDVGGTLAPMFRRLVQAGFVVLAPLLRGSDGEAGTDEMGGADLADLMQAVGVAHASGVADTARLFLYGESRGGMMVFQALRDGFPAHAAVTVGGFTDLEDMIAADTTHLAPVARTIWPDWPTAHARIAERRSAIRWPERLRVPVLLLHGTEDAQVSPRQSETLAAAIRRAGGRCTLRLVPDAGHTLRGHEALRDSLAIAWFRAAMPHR